MNIINLSAQPMGKLYSWLSSDLQAEKFVFLPDACPGKSPLPTGTAVVTSQPDWRRFAISDCGCGMRLLKSELHKSDVNQTRWDNLASSLRKNKGGLGDLGGGNHFLDALYKRPDRPVYFLIHTGSRDESGHVDSLVDDPNKFDIEFKKVFQWAYDNRQRIQDLIESVFNKVELVLDLAHNSYEINNDESVIIRKGSIKLYPGELCIIPSHMTGDALLAKATEKVREILFSMSHGTGRSMSRGECKSIADNYDFSQTQKQILLPTGFNYASLRTEGPFAYRELDKCLMLIDDYIEEVCRFEVIAYMGHL